MCKALVNLASKSVAIWISRFVYKGLSVKMNIHDCCMVFFGFVLGQDVSYVVLVVLKLAM